MDDGRDGLRRQGTVSLEIFGIIEHSVGPEWKREVTVTNQIPRRYIAFTCSLPSTATLFTLNKQFIIMTERWSEEKGGRSEGYGSHGGGLL